MNDQSKQTPNPKPSFSIWIFYDILIRLLVIGAVFVIYFRSPIITDLQPQNDLPNPPAKRLVLIITDGLRADSFFENNYQYVQNIKKIFMNNGLLGISRTHVPTESRPGHIAIIAGLYEDPSAVTKGWKENPIDFDSIFNRSQKTYAWGNNDILSIFAKCTDREKIEFFSYTDAVDFSGKDETYLLDDWVFSRVKMFLSNQTKHQNDEEKVIYFLHLLGLDTSGHIHKPGSEMFYKNLQFTDKGVYEMYQLFEKHFPDKKTAYVLTSDHGMTNLGSHGAGDTHETETPLVIWGAGVNNWFDMQDISSASSSFPRSTIIDEKIVPLLEVEQADLSPLMSSLIGIAPPMNNFGKLPMNVLNVSTEYFSLALLNNALQISAQYFKLRDEFNRGLFSKFLNTFDKLQEKDIEMARGFDKNPGVFKDQEVATSIVTKCNEILSKSIEGIEYFQQYYKHILQFCVTLTQLAEILQFVILLNSKKIDFSIKKIPIIMYILLIVVLIFVFAQKVPFTVSIYFILPIISLIVPLQNITIYVILNAIRKNLKKIAILFIATEMLVGTFFIRQLISFLFLGVVGFKAYKMLKPFKDSQEYSRNFVYSYFISIALILIFPFLPSANGRNDAYCIFFALLVWTSRATNIKAIKENKLASIYSIVFVINYIMCYYFYSNKIGIPLANLCISWILLVLALIGPLFSDDDIQAKIKLIVHYLTSIYISLSVSYESLFVIFLGSHFLSNLELKIHQNISTKTILMHHNTNDPNKDDDNEENEATILNFKKWTSMEISFNILLFTIISFFGTGNIASISSFDPNTSRYYVTTFSPFTIMSLVILKLSIPLFLIIAGFCWYMNKKISREIFICLLIICKLLSLNFFFMITNKGSWLQIGTSISHFIIMEVTTIVLGLIYFIFKFLIHFKLSDFTKTAIVKEK